MIYSKKIEPLNRNKKQFKIIVTKTRNSKNLVFLTEHIKEKYQPKFK